MYFKSSPPNRRPCDLNGPTFNGRRRADRIPIYQNTRRGTVNYSGWSGPPLFPNPSNSMGLEAARSSFRPFQRPVDFCDGRGIRRNLGLFDSVQRLNPYPRHAHTFCESPTASRLRITSRRSKPGRLSAPGRSHPFPLPEILASHPARVRSRYSESGTRTNVVHSFLMSRVPSAFHLS